MVKIHLHPEAISRFLIGAGTWAADWQGKVFGIYLDIGTGTALESGYTFNYDHLCYDVSSGALPRSAPTGSPLDGYVGGGAPYWIYPIQSIP